MIHVIKDGDDWDVWTDTDEDSVCDGRCLASESSKRQAIAAAITKLEDDLRVLRDMIA